ncbi:MAG: glycosyltransferase [Armatimonadetes bacterium]|nr:glycosyltransferase [Armatimonadota bacterium]
MRNEFGFGDSDPVLVAGSTHPKEEQFVLEAFTQLRTEFPSLQLVIAPRHIERADSVQELVHSYGYSVYRRSHAKNGQPQPEPAGPQARVVILDTIGELSRVYALATVVFVGGSIARVGGHNILEPLAQGKPVIVGPYTHNFREIVAVAKHYGLVEEVRSPKELEAAVSEFLRNRQRVSEIAARAQEMLSRERQAAARIADALVELLHRARAVQV